MRLSMLARDCLRSGLSGALAAGMFGAAMAGALVATGPKALPATTIGMAPAVSRSIGLPRTVAAGAHRVEVLGQRTCGARARWAEVARPSAVTKH